MPLVRDSAAAPSAAAPASAAPAASPARFNRYGVPVARETAQEQLKRAAALAAPTGGILDPLAAPARNLITTLSRPAYAIGALISGDPAQAAQQAAQIPVGVAGLVEPRLGKLARRIPNITPEENVLPGEALKRRGWLPGGTLGDVLGFGADVFGDPWTYVTFGAGAGLSAVARAPMALARKEAAAELRAAAKAGRTGTAAFEDIQKAGTRHAEAEIAERQARGRGAHVRLGLAGTRFTKEVGTLPTSRAIAKGAAGLRAKVLKKPGAQQAAGRFEEQFLTGGRVRKRAEYKGARMVERVASRERQKATLEASTFHRQFVQAVNALKKGGADINTARAYEQLAHHIEQPERFQVDEALRPFAERARAKLDEYKGLEETAGINYEAVPDYLPHHLRRESDRARFEEELRRKGFRPSMGSPSFVKAREVPNIETLKSLGFDPETNVARLLELRGHAHVDAMRDQGIRRGIVAERGVRAPLPPEVPVEAFRETAEGARENLKTLSQPQPLGGARETVASTLAERGGAELGVQVGRRVPHFARQSRTQRRLAEARAARGEAQQMVREAPPELVEEARTTLAQARREVEKRRRAAVKAASAKDPAVRAQARRQLSAAIRTHIDARIALANLRGRTAGSAAEIQKATRASVRAQAVFGRAERESLRAKEIAKRMAAQPGRPATAQEWKDLQKEWVRVKGRFNRDVLIPPDAAEVIERIEREMTRSLRRHQDAGQVSRFVEKLTSHWKALALLSPGYHSRNAQGDALGAWWAGARNPISFVQATRIVKARNDPAALDKLSIKVGGERMTGREFLEEADSVGVSGQGQIGVEIAPTAQEAETKIVKGVRAIPGLRAAPGRGAGVRTSGRVGQFREDATRLGTYLDLRRQGMDSIAAANRVSDFLFDYGHVSDFVDMARRFWTPFVTYSAKAVPRTLKQAATRPGYFSHHAEAVELSQNLAGVEEPLGNLPFGQRSSFAIPDPGGRIHDLLGIPQDQPLMWNPERSTPWGTLNSLDTSNLQQTIASNLPNPLLQTGLETALGHNLYYAGNMPKRAVAPPLIQGLESLGVPIPGFGPKMSAALEREVPGYSSTLNELLNLLPVYGQQGRLTNIEDPQKWAQSLAGFLGGLSLSSYDRAELAARAQKYGGGG